MSADSGDDAPVEVTLTQSKEEVTKRIENEKIHQKRHKKNAKKRKPNWAKSQINKNKNKNKNKKRKEMDESQFNDNDFKENNDLNEPLTKKRRLNKWMKETDLFHHLNTDDEENKNNKQEIDDTEIEQETIENNEGMEGMEDMEDFEDEEVPQEVIDLFEKAMKESKSEKELQDKWQKIIDEQSKKYSNLKHKLSSFDKVFIDGFQIEINGVYRLNVSALKRALRMKHFSTKNHHRIRFNKKQCYGSMKPSFGFIEGSVNNNYNLKNKQFQPSSFWGQKLNHITKVAKQDQLEKWLEF